MSTDGFFPMEIGSVLKTMCKGRNCDSIKKMVPKIVYNSSLDPWHCSLWGSKQLIWVRLLWATEIDHSDPSPISFCGSLRWKNMFQLVSPSCPPIKNHQNSTNIFGSQQVTKRQDLRISPKIIVLMTLFPKNNPKNPARSAGFPDSPRFRRVRAVGVQCHRGLGQCRGLGRGLPRRGCHWSVGRGKWWGNDRETMGSGRWPRSPCPCRRL